MVKWRRDSDAQWSLPIEGGLATIKVVRHRPDSQNSTAWFETSFLPFYQSHPMLACTIADAQREAREYAVTLLARIRSQADPN